MDRCSLSLLIALPALSLTLSSCNLGEDRDIVVTTTPLGADVYLNERYAGSTPVAKKVSNRKQLDIYIDKDGYFPVEKTVIPEKSFWGWLLWDRVDDKSLSLPEDTFIFNLEKMPQGTAKKVRFTSPPQKTPSYSAPRSIQ